MQGQLLLFHRNRLSIKEDPDKYHGIHPLIGSSASHVVIVTRKNENPKCRILQAWLWGMAHYDAKIDRNMRVLLGILHHYLNIRTYASCGGHIKQSGRVNPAPKGEFHVSFFLPLNYPGGFDKNTLSIIREAVRLYEGNVFLENDNETYNLPIKDGCCSWSISGYGISPIHFASTLFSQYLVAKRNR